MTVDIEKENIPIDDEEVVYNGEQSVIHESSSHNGGGSGVREDLVLDEYIYSMTAIVEFKNSKHFKIHLLRTLSISRPIQN